MPPKKDKKRKTRKTKKAVRRGKTSDIQQASQYGNLIKAIGDLKGSLMSRNAPIPGSSQFTPFIGYQDQAVSVIRANAANTVARLDRELSEKLSKQEEGFLREQTARSMPITVPSESLFEQSIRLGPKQRQTQPEEEESAIQQMYQNIYEQTGGGRGMTKLAKQKAKVAKEVMESIPEGGLAQAGISMRAPGQAFGPDRPSPFQLLEERRATSKKLPTKEQPIFEEM